ncbi:hypothetical protein [Ferrovibrio sp.]|uniref:hypothetical protein n=1 Tax=Ferrovibrio sp. TaxID=1917215 RepID=UPI000CBF074D|nr:hypothetical protein [Ferrovibrio sp.]PJI39604.1 MAG: hypothetical protein CTR53_12335 [Ferrovibrio sp.]
MLKAAAIALVLAAGFYAGSASAFCVQNDGTTPLVVQAGGPPMPVYVKPNLMPGERDCHVPRKPDGITVEIFDGRTRQMRCRLSVPAKDATIFVDKTCRAKLG